MASAPSGSSRRGRAWLASVVGSRTAPGPADLALVVVRVGLAWIFIHYGSGKLFGWFNGPGIHRTALFFSPDYLYNTLYPKYAEYFADAMNKIGSMYFTKEAYDKLYPGYGSSYINFYGGAAGSNDAPPWC